ncbi:GNAT family N-acetyltransferase [Mesorhizobium sp. SB112]|uniref:GNAT family N-acetyltransferase n=1 Tax=Mesorhizobium sp. SB112 TaxID=3151853 RepID=UPI00326617F4
MGVDLKSLGLSRLDVVRSIELEPDQEQYAGGSLNEIFSVMQASVHPDAYHPFAIASDDKVVGFFVLREKSALPAWAPSNAVTLHNFRVDRAYQGLGYGSAGLKLASDWVIKNRPDIRLLMLSVNEGNPSIRLYLRCGFRDCRQTLNGRVGREHVLKHDIEI